MSFKFLNPGLVRVRTRVSEDPNVIDISSEIWKWKDGGLNHRVNWNKLHLSNELKEILKAYIFFRLQTRSLISISSNDLRLIYDINKSKLGSHFPWTLSEIINYVNEIGYKDPNKLLPTFRSFYKWAVNKNINGFDKKTLMQIHELKFEARKNFQKIFLTPNFITSEEELQILNLIKNNYNCTDYYEFRNTIILNLSYELGLRPIQLFNIDTSDFKIITSNNNDIYYSIDIALAKKLSNNGIQKKTRSISSSLGQRIEEFILKDKEYFKSSSIGGLFKKFNKYKIERVSTYDFSQIIIEQLKTIGFGKGDGATLLRHHLAQSLADQGASADIIAEILGHNSTIAARAYIAATPEIANIKTKALGKSKTYENIMKMLLTGKIIDKNSISKERWVKGMIGNQYIGGIGSCGLPENTSCPFNPVYSCYTCHKFHPFVDGRHEEVKLNLQKQAQSFIDTAEASMDIKYNRPVIQLEKTIEAVDSVIERCKGGKNE